MSNSAAAVHLVTESSDHSTLLIEYQYIDDLVDNIKDIFGEEFSYIQGIYVASNVDGDDYRIERAIREAVYANQEAE